MAVSCSVNTNTVVILSHEKELFIDLTSRFYANVPAEEQGLMRLMYHVECMFFFLIDHWLQLRQTFTPLPCKPWNLTEFIEKYKKWCPFLEALQFSQAWEEYIEVYKKQIPVGAALLFRGTDVLMVKGKESGCLGIPKGKVNAHETYWECMIREVEEETGWNGLRLFTDNFEFRELEYPQVPPPRKRDYKQPLRPKSLLLQPELKELTLYYVDLHKHEPHFMFNRKSPITPTRVYLISFDYIVGKLMEKNQEQQMTLLHVDPGSKEISDLVWLDFHSIRRHKRGTFTWQIRRHARLLEEARAAAVNMSLILQSKDFNKWGQTEQKLEQNKEISIRNVLSELFPFGTYNQKIVAEVIQNTSYLQFLKDKRISRWIHSSLLKQLIELGILNIDQVTVERSMVSLCKQLSLSATTSGTTECVFCSDTLPIQGVRFTFHPCGHAVICENCVVTQRQHIRMLTKCSCCNATLDSCEPIRKLFL